MLIKVGISCCFVFFCSLFVVCCSGSTTSVGEERELVFLLLFTCIFVVSVLGSFLFLLVLRMGCAILLWHSLGLPLSILTTDVSNIIILITPFNSGGFIFQSLIRYHIIANFGLDLIMFAYVLK